MSENVISMIVAGTLIGASLVLTLVMLKDSGVQGYNADEAFELAKKRALELTEAKALFLGKGNKELKEESEKEYEALLQRYKEGDFLDE